MVLRNMGPDATNRPSPHRSTPSALVAPSSITVVGPPSVVTEKRGGGAFPPIEGQGPSGSLGRPIPSLAEEMSLRILWPWWENGDFGHGRESS